MNVCNTSLSHTTVRFIIIIIIIIIIIYIIMQTCELERNIISFDIC